MREYDYLIVGQGIAGSVLAWKLLERGYRILIIDNAHKESSSLVAAGLLNPITGKRLVKSWLLDENLPIAYKFYKELESAFKTTFFRKDKVLRLCQSENELVKLNKRKADPAYTQYLGDVFAPNHNKSLLKDELDSFEILGAGCLNVPSMLNCIREYLKSKEALREEAFDYQNLEKYSADKIIFCEGFQCVHNPYFSWLPFSPAKGEYLSLEFSEKVFHSIVHKKHNAVPMEGSRVRFGATYAWDILDTTPTQEAREYLLKALEDITPLADTADMIDQLAGIRPCTRDAKPFIGQHPQKSPLFIFNGFGSKGILQIPYFADHLIRFLENQSVLNDQVDILRYNDYYKE